MALLIRSATAKDMDDVLRLIKELALYEKEPDAVKITAETLRQMGTGPDPLFKCFVAQENDVIVGMALVYFRFSTWVGKSLHLEDLVVAQEHRGKGIGSALYTQVMRYASSKNVNRVEWVVLDWNTPAVAFYKKSGALLLTDWHLAQMDETRLKNYLKKIDSK
jgi:ribosomal protein S18 acetylase RimI-like enzyme